MKNTYKKGIIHSQYFYIDIFDSPIQGMFSEYGLDVLSVNIENYRIDPKMLFSASLGEENIGIKNATGIIDFSLTLPEYIMLEKEWDKNGCYAIFHSSPHLRPRISDISEPSRYKILDHFDWKLEVAIPGGASDGWGRFVSPQSQIIDHIETYIRQQGYISFSDI